MSTCISSYGEFGSHEFGDPASPLTCDLCGVFDEDAAVDRLLSARFLVGDWQANGNSRPLGDPTAAVWHLAARQLLAVLDGREAHDVDPRPTPSPAAESCACGSPNAYSLNPADVVVHRTDGPCYITGATDQEAGA